MWRLRAAAAAGAITAPRDRLITPSPSRVALDTLARSPKLVRCVIPGRVSIFPFRSPDDPAESAASRCGCTSAPPRLVNVGVERHLFRRHPQYERPSGDEPEARGPRRVAPRRVVPTRAASVVHAAQRRLRLPRHDLSSTPITAVRTPPLLVHGEHDHAAPVTWRTRRSPGRWAGADHEAFSPASSPERSPRGPIASVSTASRSNASSRRVEHCAARQAFAEAAIVMPRTFTLRAAIAAPLRQAWQSPQFMYGSTSAVARLHVSRRPTAPPRRPLVAGDARYCRTASAEVAAGRSRRCRRCTRTPPRRRPGPPARRSRPARAAGCGDDVSSAFTLPARRLARALP